MQSMRVYCVPFKAMGGPCEVQLAARDEKEAIAFAQLAIDEVRRIEHKYSRYEEHSVVSEINRSAGQAVTLDKETESLLAYAMQLFKDSDGLFDITSGVFRKAWNFKSGALPSQQSLDALLPQVGMHHLSLTGNQLRLSCGEIDFGGFGKEYAADRAALQLKQQGVAHALINLSGDLHALGSKPDGQPWQVGIQHPRDARRMIADVPLTLGGLATSGDYERYMEVGKQRYCHVLNPKTGWPVNYWQSVTVIAPTTLHAGSLTSLVMLNEAAGLQILQNSRLSYLAIDRLGQIYSN